MADLEQKRRTVRVLELLTESFEAHQRGDHEAVRVAVVQAMECDDFALAGIQGGIVIGEIPNPERDWLLWTEYVSVNKEALAAMEDDAYIAEHGSDNLDTGHIRDPEGDEAAHG